MTDAAGYARYSTELQNETSIVAQINGINTCCQSNNLRLTEMYIDEAKSGTNTSRNGYERMIEDAHQRKFQAIVVYDITRGSRDVVDWLSFRKEMRALGIKVYSATERLGDISKPGDFLTELITVGIGQHQVLQSREKSIDGKRVRASRGLFCGGVAPLGYDVQDGLYIINEREAEVVRMAFRMYANGRSYAEIANEIDKTGVRGKKGQRICDNTLYYILRNKRYIGTYSWFDEEKRYMHKWVGKKHDDPIVLENRIPPIIDAATWETVHRRMKENTKNRMNKSSIKQSYLLSGLLRCQKCGYAYYGMISTVRKKSGQKYGCICRPASATGPRHIVHADR